MYERLLANIKSEIVNPVIFLMFALATLYFLWGVFNFIRNSAGSEGRDTGLQHILWGAVGMFIMISAYGIINFVVATVYQ
jgi:uncharacterized membrane protein YjfL (UPF0719 family)